MAASIPSSFLTDLAKETCYPVWVYELELKKTPAETKYYAGEYIPDWNGQAYERMAIRCSAVKQDIDPAKINDVRLIISNITHELRDNIEPDDHITDGRLTIRLLMRDSSGNWLQDGGQDASYIVFRGLMEAPERVDASTFEVSAVWIDQVAWQKTPGRKFSPRCSWRFADGINCNYTGGLLTCNRLLQSVDGCDGRARRQEFSGFRSDQSLILGLFDPKPNIRIIEDVEIKPDITVPFITVRSLIEGSIEDALADETKSVPLIYGRRIFRGIELTRGIVSIGESAGDAGSPPGDLRNMRTLALSEGQISNVNFWISEDESGTRNYVNNVLFTGYWWRDGSIGIGSPVQRDSGAHVIGADIKRPQNQDQHAWGIGANADYYLTFSRTAYATFFWPTEQVDENVQGEWQVGNDVAFDISGILINAYDTNGSVADTQPYNNPVWQCVDLDLHQHYGTGRLISTSDIDFTEAYNSAVYCDALLTSATANTVLIRDANNTDRLNVDSTQGFFPGHTIDVGGDARTVKQVAGMKTLIINSPITKTTGTTVVATVERFTSNQLITQERETYRVKANILRGCRGYRTYDDGKIQYKIEQPVVPDVGHFQDTGYSEGYAIIADSFRWAFDRDSDVNRVIVNYSKNDGTTSTLSHEVTDWDHLFDRKEKVRTIDARGITTIEEADRVGQFYLSLARDVGRGANFMVGPIGLRLQPGDKIFVTHSVPNWSSKACIVTTTEVMGLGSRDSFLVKVTVRPYDANIYVDTATPPDVLIDEPIPTVKLVVESFDPATFRVTLRWWIEDAGSDTTYATRWSLYKQYGTFGDPPSVSIEDRIRVFRAHTMSFEYQITEADFATGQSIFFIIKAGTPTGASPFSNEVEVDPYAFIAGDSSNMVYGGDFDDAADWREDDAVETARNPTGNSANTPEDDDGLNNPGNAADGNTETYAEGDFTKATSYSEGQIYTFVAAGFTNKFGVAEVRSRLQYAQVARQGHWEAYTDIADGNGWVSFGNNFNTNWYVTKGPVEYISDSDLQVKVRAVPEVSRFREAGSGSAQFSIVRFVEYTPPFAVVRGSKAYLCSDVAGTFVEVSRPFPYFNPARLRIVLRQGEPYTCRVALSYIGPTAVDGDFQVALWDEDRDVSWSVLHIDNTNNSYSDITTNEEHFGTTFIPTSDVTGPLRVVVRSAATACVKVDKLGIYHASVLPDFDIGGNEKTQTGRFGEKSARSLRPVTFGKRVMPLGPYAYFKRTNTT